MKTYQISLVLALILFISCKKEEKSFTEVNGTVYDKGTNKRIIAANALVFFEWRQPLTYGARTHYIDTTRTDAQGRYSFGVETPNEDLHVYGTSHQHYPGGDLGMMPNIQRGRQQTLNLELIPFGWIRMNITKTGAFDWMGIGPPNGSSKPLRVFSDTVLIVQAVGNEHVNVFTFKFLNGQQNNFPYSVQTIGRDTVDISIEF